MKGVSEMKAAVQAIAKKFPDRVAAALYTEAQIVMTESKRRCPVAKDGGVLRASGMVATPVRSAARGISVTLSYGGAASAYAIAVHEHISEHDPPSWQTMNEEGRMIQWTTPGTGDHFLSGPINEAVPEMGKRLAARLDLNKEGQ